MEEGLTANLHLFFALFLPLIMGGGENMATFCALIIFAIIAYVGYYMLTGGVTMFITTLLTEVFKPRNKK